MDTRPNDLHVELRSTARAFLAQAWPIASVRAHRAGDDDGLRELWPAMAELGWLGMSLPETYGGADASLLDVALLAEELGRALVPTTFSSTLVGAALVERLGTEDQRAALLPSVCQGTLRLSLALTEGAGSYDVATVAARASRVEGGWRLDGTKMFVPDAATAGYLMVVAQVDGSPARPGVFLVEPDRAGVRVAPLPTIGGDRQAKVVLDGAVVPHSALLGHPSDAAAAIAWALEVAVALQLADVIGVGDHVLQKTVAYVKTRHAFGVPIGAFQAVQHQCADMAIALDCARLMTHEAIWRLSDGLGADLELAGAKAFAPQAVKQLTLAAHHLHGGAGYTTEDELHLYSGRAKAAEQVLGTPDDHLELVARAIGLGRPPHGEP